MADQTLVIDGNLSPYVQKVNQARAATKGLVKEASGIGDAFTKAMLKVEILKRALDAVGNGITTIVDKSKAASKSGSARAIDLATSFGSLGVKDVEGMSQKVANGRGLSTLEDRVSFAAQLAGANKSRQAPMSDGDVSGFMDLYTAGGDVGFGKGGEELISAATKGISPAEARAMAMRKRPGMAATLNDPTGAVSTEYATANMEDRATMVDERLRRDVGISARSTAARLKMGQANNQTLDTINSILPDAMSTAASLSQDTQGLNRIYKEVAKANELTRQTLTRPTYSTNVEGR